jgi:hypothetical protein
MISMMTLAFSKGSTAYMPDQRNSASPPFRQGAGGTGLATVGKGSTGDARTRAASAAIRATSSPGMARVSGGIVACRSFSPLRFGEAFDTIWAAPCL